MMNGGRVMANCKKCNATMYKCSKCGAIGCRGGHNGNCPNQTFEGNVCLQCGATNTAKPI